MYINAAWAKQTLCLGSEPSWLPKMRRADTLENRHDSIKRYQVGARSIDDSQAVIITTSKTSTARASKMSHIRMTGFMGQLGGYTSSCLENSLSVSWSIFVVVLQLECWLSVSSSHSSVPYWCVDVKGRSVSHIDSCTGQHHAILELELDRRYTERVSMLEGLYWYNRYATAWHDTAVEGLGSSEEASK